MPLPPTREEFFRHGPGPEVWEPLARRPAQIDVATNRIRLPSHGLSSDEPLTLSAGEAFGGAGELPAGLSPFVTYYARVVSSALFELAASPGGAAIDFGPGEGTHGLVVEVDMGPAIDQALRFESDRFLACAAENEWAEPLAGWGGDVKNIVMDLAAWPLLDRRGYRSPESVDGYMIRWKAATEAMRRFCEGATVPLGVEVPVEPGGGEEQAYGSSGFGDEDRGYGGRESYLDRRVPTI